MGLKGLGHSGFVFRNFELQTVNASYCKTGGDTNRELGAIGASIVRLGLSGVFCYIIIIIKTPQIVPFLVS